MKEDWLPTTKTSIEPGSERLLLCPQFLDHDGKDYLNGILQRILPMALWRTWFTAVGFPRTLGDPCYLTAAEIAKRAGIGQGKVEKDLRDLEARRLLQHSVKRRLLWHDGQPFSQPALVKDFESLYKLAYEYHLWCNSPEYIPPERDFLDVILADRELVHKLIRFENYRRLLVCAKPGKPPQVRSFPVAYRNPPSESTET